MSGTLALLREDLALLPGPVLADGQPSWTLHDPARNLFFRIDWPSFEMLRRWTLASPQRIAEEVCADTTLHLDDQDVKTMEDFLVRNQLTVPGGPDAAREMAARRAAQRGNLVSWLLHHYLFFRIPLARPDAWLGRWSPLASRVASPFFLWLTLAAGLLGMAEVMRHWDVFTSTLVDHFNLQGLAAYGVALFGVKLLHELGHAFTAKHHGCRVPTMGVAFLVMWPVAYTDTNDAWRLTNPTQRLQVAAAGIATELAVAAWATLAWALLPEGSLRSAAFVLATTSWVATLAINASPFMRMDGYFVLCDWLDFPNLHERSFALARWHLRERLFALGEEPPEHLSPRRHRALLAFAWATWLYRLVLFVGIALMVYHLFFKLLGVLLFAVELAWFVLRPLRSEWQAWQARRDAIRRGGRGPRLLALLAGLALLLALPWPGRVQVSGLLRPAEVWPLHAPSAARLEALPWKNGDTVPAGEVLVRLEQPELRMREAALRARLDNLRLQVGASGFDADARQQWQVVQEALTTAEAEYAALQTELVQHAPTAPWAGRLHDLDPDLQAGQWLGKRERLGVLVREGSPWLVETWVPEEVVQRVAIGDEALFVTDSASGPAVHLRVQGIDRDASRVLPRPELSAQLGGHVLVREQARTMVPERAVYRVQLTPVDASGIASLQQHSWRGQLTIRVRSEAPVLPYLRQAFAVLVRETGF
ncbi:HlyD family efflux transporter periplasmic adaptor subunit [Hydrogenophaga luteola]|uniref:HlyD family efflux transporter periplasmic adaptor subunit n=1 Tax=Hydrogenophaga luteola TaxID=1591122 RepID=A0ABV7W6N6_9BURK